MAKRIVAIGNSIVYGRIDPIGGGWVGRLRSWYVAREPAANAVFNLGIGGDTTTSLIHRFGVECEAREPDIILLGIGVNDSRRVGSPSADHDTAPELFARNLDSLLTTSRGLAPATVFVSMVPVDESRTAPIPVKGYWHLLDDQRKFHDITREQCQKHGIPLIDNFNRWLSMDSHLSGLGRPKYARFLEDGLHPNAEGHKDLFKVVKAFLQKEALL